MSSRRPKTTGWAAFNQQQRQQAGLESPPSDNPFPSLSSNMNSLEPLDILVKNNHQYVKPFASVLLTSAEFPSPLDDSWKSGPPAVGTSGSLKSSEMIEEGIFFSVFRQLKELYSWADESLIEDVMAAAGNDFDKASSFLKAMVSDESVDNKVAGFTSEVLEGSRNNSVLRGKGDVSSWKSPKPIKVCSVGGICNGNETVSNDYSIQAQNLFDDGVEIDARLDQLTYVPIEPEWEEEDLYLRCRKDAIRVMRAAARHTKSATNSFYKGDHFASQQFAEKAREEWAAAERLNVKAAQEILTVRNENNGLWRLDLHGLHASEAVQALQERLNVLEIRKSSKNSGPFHHMNGLRTKLESINTSSPDGQRNKDISDEQAFSRPKSIILEVITGVGNHSRGGAALPVAIKNFLVDNGYHFDEFRPGVVTVRPKFHHR